MALSAVVARRAVLPVILAVAAAVVADEPKPATVDAVRDLQSAYRSERQQADATGATRIFAPDMIRRAEDAARQGDAALAAGQLDEAAKAFHDARWQLPVLPVDLPPHVGHILGNPRLRHGGKIEALSFSSDGKRLASAADDNTVIVWDLANGRELLTYRGHKDKLKAAAFSPDGTTIASAGGPDIVLWDSRTGKEKQSLKGHAGYVTCLAYRPDGKALASAGSEDKSVRVWDLGTGKETVNLGPQNSQIFSVAYSPDGKLLASANGDGAVNIYCPESKNRRFPLGFKAHDGQAYQVAFSPDGKSFASCGHDKTVKVHGAPAPDGEPLDGTGALKRKLENLPDDVTTLAFGRDGRTLATGSSDHGVRLWDLPTGQVLRTFQGHADGVTVVAFSPDGKTLASGSFDQTIRLWPLDPADAHRTLSGHQGFVWSAAFAPDSRHVVSGGADRTVRIWDGADGKELRVLNGHTQAVTAVAYSPDGQQVVSAGGDRVLRLWDAATFQLVRTFEGHEAPVLAVAYRPGGRQFVSGSSDRSVRVWDADTGKAVAVLTGHASAVCAVAVRADGLQAASASTDGIVKLWDLAHDSEAGSFKAHESGGVSCLAYSSDGQWLATAGGGKQIRIWNLWTRPLRDPFYRLDGHAGPVSSVAISPNGEYLASAGSDQVVKVWNLQTRSEVRSYRGHADWVTSVAFSPDGKSIVSASVDRQVMIWRFAADEADTNAGGHTREVTALSVSGDGRFIATGSRDRTARLWDAASGSELRTFGGHAAGVSGVALSADGKTLLTYTNDRKLRAWDASTGRELRSAECEDSILLLTMAAGSKNALAWSRHDGASEDDQIHTVQVIDPESLRSIETLSDRGRRLTCLAFSADGSLVAMGALDGSVRIWNLVKKERLGADRPTHAKRLADVAITPDNKKLVTCDEEGEVKVWAIDGPEPLQTFRTAGGAAGLAVGPDGRIATYTGSGTIELWDLATGKSSRRWDLRCRVNTVTFFPDGKHIATANDNGTVYLLDLP